MIQAFVGLGSNLGDSVAHLNDARTALARIPGTHLEAVSPLYRSAPIGPQDQPDFFNAVIVLQTSQNAQALLAALQQIEQQAGRIRLRHWGERTLDLDLLLFGQQTINQPDLQVPHPRLHQRAFVLRPLLDIAPRRVLPDGTDLASCCAALEDQPLCLHEDDRWSLTP